MPKSTELKYNYQFNNANLQIGFMQQQSSGRNKLLFHLMIVITWNWVAYWYYIVITIALAPEKITKLWSQAAEGNINQLIEKYLLYIYINIYISICVPVYVQKRKHVSMSWSPDRYLYCYHLPLVSLPQCHCHFQFIGQFYQFKAFNVTCRFLWQFVKCFGFTISLIPYRRPSQLYILMKSWSAGAGQW